MRGHKTLKQRMHVGAGVKSRVNIRQAGNPMCNQSSECIIHSCGAPNGLDFWDIAGKKPVTYISARAQRLKYRVDVQSWKALLDIETR